MPLLYHWVGENYRRDLDWGAGYHLNQSNPLLHEISLGDSLWAFTRTTIGTYVLAVKLVVRAKTRNASGFRYGPYRLWGDLKRSRYFRTKGQPDISELIRRLSVKTNAPVVALGGFPVVPQCDVADAGRDDADRSCIRFAIRGVRRGDEEHGWVGIRERAPPSVDAGVSRGKKYTFQNPLRQNYRHAKAVEAVLAPLDLDAGTARCGR